MLLGLPVIVAKIGIFRKKVEVLRDGRRIEDSEFFTLAFQVVCHGKLGAKAVPIGVHMGGHNYILRSIQNFLNGRPPIILIYFSTHLLESRNLICLLLIRTNIVFTRNLNNGAFQLKFHQSLADQSFHNKVQPVGEPVQTTPPLLHLI